MQWMRRFALRFSNFATLHERLEDFARTIPAPQDYVLLLFPHLHGKSVFSLGQHFYVR
jgi:hypothetical protein